MGMIVKKMVKNLLKENDTLRELLVGILLFGLVSQIVLLFFTKNRVYHSIGLWIGIVMACFMSFHMAETLDTALLLGEKGADSYLRKKSAIRYFIVCVVVVVAGVIDFCNPLTCMLGIMGLKIGAYLQPATHKFFLKLLKSEDKGGE